MKLYFSRRQMKKTIVIAGCLVLLSTSASAQVRTKSNKEYVTWPETRTRTYYQSDPDPKKAGWKTERDTIYRYEEQDSDEPRNQKKEKVKSK